MVGETLGHYRIEARLGAGGMGVVYRAQDEKLHRTVAIKVVGGGKVKPEDRARLIDEARAASHLTHPNICTVYEVGEADGHAFIVMEFVAGRLLSEIIPPGGLPAETVVRLGAQIADALAHAHDRGVIHRDLKSANVAVNDQGPKVLDFGIARRTLTSDSDGETRPISPSESKVVFGTLAYVAPEVLLGEQADARSDIWALGVMLWELAAGELPFAGRSEFELTAAILRSPPRAMPAHVPPILRAIIQRCLAKDPAQRYQRAGEIRAALDAMQSGALMAPVAAPGRGPSWTIIAIAAALVALAGLGAWTYRSRTPDLPDWAALLKAGQLTQIVSTPYRTFDPTLSSDGRMLAYVAELQLGRTDLLVGRVAGGARVQLTNDEAREESPRFSPDGEWVAFTRRDSQANTSEIRILPALGGEVRATIPGASSPAWSADGAKLAYLRRGGGAGPSELTVSNVDGSDAQVVLAADSTYPFMRSPAWSPDRQAVTIVRGTGGVAGELWEVPVNGGTPRRLITEPASTYSDAPMYTADGRGIVHASNRGGAANIWLLPLGGGEPVRLTTGPGPDESPSIAADGTIAFVNSRWRNTLDIADVSGTAAQTILTHSPFLWGPAISKDSQEIAFSRGEVDGNWHIWLVPVAGGEAKRLTSSEAGEVYSRYAPDGSIWFHTWDSPRRIGRVPPGGGPPVMLSFGVDASQAFPDPSPDGKQVAFTISESDAERIYLAPSSGGQPRKLTASPGTVARWSPDGTRLAFSANRGYSGGVFIINADGTGEHRLTNEGGWPVWWPDGKTIGFVALGPGGDQEIRQVSLDGSHVRTLSNVRFIGSNHPFAVFPDGRRLAVTNAVHVSDEIWLLQPAKK